MLRCFLRNQNPHVKDGIFFHDISSRNKMQQVHILHRERKKKKKGQNDIIHFYAVALKGLQDLCIS